jgi:hypothetical protein
MTVSCPDAIPVPICVTVVVVEAGDFFYTRSDGDSRAARRNPKLQSEYFVAEAIEPPAQPTTAADGKAWKGAKK